LYPFPGLSGKKPINRSDPNKEEEAADVRDAELDALNAYEKAEERRQAIIAAWEEEGRPLTSAVSTQLVVAVNLVTALVFIAFGMTDLLVRLPGYSVAALAILPVLNGALLAAYVFGEDSYRGNGISRWEAYRSPNGALGPMFVLSLGVMALCAVILIYAALGPRGRLFRTTALGGGIACLILVFPTIAGFSLN
jgi:hypothetical protein